MANGVNAVFLQERYGIYQHLSAKGVIMIWKACIAEMRFKITSSEEVKGFHQMASAYKSWPL
jgi:hypothetical protein